MNHQQTNEFKKDIGKIKETHQFFPIIEAGFEESVKNDLEIEPLLWDWFCCRFDYPDAEYFYNERGIGFGYELRGERVFYSQDFHAQTNNGTVDVGTEVFLTDDGNLMKFHTFKESRFCKNCQKNHTIVQRMIAKDQALSNDELDTISNSSSDNQYEEHVSQLPTTGENNKLDNLLSDDQINIIKKAANLWLPPVFEDGTDVTGLYDEKAYCKGADGEPRWSNLEFEIADAGVAFPVDGMRVLYSPIQRYETVNGYAGIDTEVFLTDKVELLKFLTFRDTTIYTNQEVHTRLHRVITEDQSLTCEEIESILKSISSYLKYTS